MNNILGYKPITDLLTEIIDNRGKSVPTVERGFPLIATNCIKESSIYPTFEKVRYVSDEILKTWFRAHLKPNDILFVNKGTPGRVCLVPNPVTFCAAQDMMAFRCNPELINYNYLFTVLRSAEIQKKIANNHVGLVIPHFRKQELDSLLIPIRSIKEQEAIGNLYILLSAKIELNNKINAELEAMAKTIYDYWFVQFDFPYSPPVEGLGVGQGKPYKSSGGKMVYNEQLKREIPEGWEVELMEDWIELNKSGDWGKEELTGNYTTKVNCIRGADINGINGLEQCNPPERFILEKNNFKMLEDGDFIVEISGGSPTQSTGRIALITDAVLKRFNYSVICSNFCKPISMKNKKHSFYFLKHWMSLYNNGIFFGFEGKTSGIKNLLFESLVSANYVIKPPENLLDRFNAVVMANHKKQQQALLENQQLTQLRDWLLPMLMNGQVTVSAAQEMLGMVAEEREGYKSKKD